MNEAMVVLISLAAELLPAGPITRDFVRTAPPQPRDATDLDDAIWALAERSEPNRWPLIEQAVQDIAPFDHIDFDATGKQWWELRDDPTAQRDAVKALESLTRAGTFDTLDAIAEGGHFLSPPSYDTLGQYRLMRQLFRACMARMELALIYGLEHEPSRAFTQAIGLALAVGAQPTLLDRAVAQAIIARACDRARHAARRHAYDGDRPGAADLRAMLAQLDQPLLPRLNDHMRALHIRSIAAADACYATDGTPLISEMMRFASSPRDWQSLGRARVLLALCDPGGRWLYAPRERTYALIAERIEAWNDIAGLPSRDAARAALALPADYARYDAPTSIAAGQLWLTIPFEARVAATQAITEFNVAATRVTLAIECYERETGTYPTSLDNLVPEYLESLPIDAITGTPFGYRKLRDTHAPNDLDDCYLLYSYAYDRLDNDAAAHPVSNDQAWRDLSSLLIPSQPAPDLRHVAPWLPAPEPVPDPVIGVDDIIDAED